MNQTPRVSVVLPVLDEEPALGECLQRIAAQTYAVDEVIVADGGSRDRSREVVADAARRDASGRIRLVDNPRRLQSAGLNLALGCSSGDVIVRLDARSFIEPDYVAASVAALRRTGAAVVGGQMVPRPGGTATARAVAAANSAWWGAGPARFHGHGADGPAETVYLGVFRRDWLDAVGGWSEDVGVNEDYELNHRIRAAGGTVWFDPDLRVEYQPRTTVAGVARQYFRYGRSKATVIRRHPSSLRLRQAAPALLLPAVTVGIVGGRLRPLGVAAVTSHLILVAVAAIRNLRPGSDAARAAVVALVMHWAWTSGLWVGFVRPFGEARPQR